MRALCSFLLALLMVLLHPGISSATQTSPADAPQRTLVLYDTSGEFGHLGDIYAQMVGNLSSRFGGWSAAPVSGYRSGDMADHDLVIYIGHADSEVLPDAFLDDVLTASTRVLWLGLNLDELHNRTYPQTNNYFVNLYGWQYRALDSSPVDSVLYKGRSLTRESRGASPIMDIVSGDTSKYEVLAHAVRTDSGTQFPWAVRTPGRKFTYVGEVPLSYVSETDRYLILSDLLFDELAPDTPQRHRALVRIEDVSPLSKPDQLRRIADILHAEGVPFSVAVIPVHLDPAKGISVTLRQAPEVVAALRYMVSKGGTLLQHGTTHQYGDKANPYGGATGDDFEFFAAHVDSNNYVILDGPVADDSAEWAQNRMAWGAQEFRDAALPAPSVFEFPHYAASEVDYQVAAQQYVARYERGLYFHERPGADGTDYSSHFGQFFPYEVTDVHGSRIIPENLGNVVDVGYNNHPAVTPQDIIDRAEKNLVVRDGFASFFFHPFLDQPERLSQIIKGIQDLGYTFVSSGDVLRQFPTDGIQAPEAASDLLAVRKGDSITVTFTAPPDPAGAPVNGYEYRLGNQGDWTAVPRQAKPTFEVPVDADHSEISVRAVNAAGRGPAVTAPVRIPLPAPSGLSATRGDRQAQVTWTAPQGSGDAVLSYEYSVDDAPWQDLGTVTSPATITGLSNGTTHSIRLRAISVAGAGQSSEPVSVTPATTPDPPGQVDVQPTFRQVTVSWVAGDDGGDPITHFTVRAMPHDGQCTATTETTCVISGLKDGQTYRFEVTATNGVGESPAVTSQSVTLGSEQVQARLVSSTDHVVAGSEVVFDASSTTAVSGRITSYEWDVDGRGFQPGSATLRHAPTAPGTSTVRVRVTGEGGVADTATRTVRVVPKSPSTPGVQVNNGAQFTRSPEVTLALGWPDGAEEAVVATDAGFTTGQRVPLEQLVKWRLAETAGSHTVYVRYLGPGIDHIVTTQIVFDPTAPTVTRAKARVVRAKGKATSYRLRTKASDTASGVRTMRVNTKKSVRGAVTRDYRRDVPVRMKQGKRLYLQVQDGAGNWSGWQRVTIRR